VRVDHIALGDHAAAVADLDPLARGEPQDIDGVPPLGAADQQLLDVGHVVQQEQRGAVELRNGVVRAHVSAR